MLTLKRIDWIYCSTCGGVELFKWNIVFTVRTENFHWPCEHSTTELRATSHITNNSPPETYPGYNMTGWLGSSVVECSHGHRKALGSSPGRATIFHLLHIDTTCVALSWSRNKQHTPSYAYLVNQIYFKSWGYVCTKNSAKELVWPHKTGYTAVDMVNSYPLTPSL